MGFPRPIFTNPNPPTAVNVDTFGALAQWGVPDELAAATRPGDLPWEDWHGTGLVAIDIPGGPSSLAYPSDLGNRCRGRKLPAAGVTDVRWIGAASWSIGGGAKRSGVGLLDSATGVVYFLTSNGDEAIIGSADDGVSTGVVNYVSRYDGGQLVPRRLVITGGRVRCGRWLPGYGWLTTDDFGAVVGGFSATHIVHVLQGDSHLLGGHFLTHIVGA